MADDMSTGTTTNIRVMEEEVNSLGIVTYERVDQPNDSHATKKVTGTQIVCTRIELILNSVHTVE